MDETHRTHCRVGAGKLAQAMPKRDRGLLNDKRLSEAVLRTQVLDEIEYLPDELAENVDRNLPLDFIVDLVGVARRCHGPSPSFRI
eukprot:506772-Pelagomonas_calceolata.AAC.2